MEGHGRRGPQWVASIPPARNGIKEGGRSDAQLVPCALCAFPGKGVVERIGVEAVGDVNGHRPGEAAQVTRARVRHDGKGELLAATVRNAVVLQDEGAAAAVQRAGGAFDGNVTRRAVHVSHGGEHLACTGGCEIAVELFGDGEAAEEGRLRPRIGRLGRQLDIECAGGALLHGDSSISQWAETVRA